MKCLVNELARRCLIEVLQEGEERSAFHEVPEWFCEVLTRNVSLRNDEVCHDVSAQSDGQKYQEILRPQRVSGNQPIGLEVIKRREPGDNLKRRPEAVSPVQDQCGKGDERRDRGGH